MAVIPSQTYEWYFTRASPGVYILSTFIKGDHAISKAYCASNNRCINPTMHKSAITQCAICNRNLHMCASLCYKLAHCGIFVQFIVGFVRWAYLWFHSQALFLISIRFVLVSPHLAITFSSYNKGGRTTEQWMVNGRKNKMLSARKLSWFN